MYPMCPLRPTAIATPGATASSMATFTILSSLAGRAVSRPELLRPSCGSTYLTGVGATAMRAGGGGGAHAAAATNERSAVEEKDFIELHPVLDFECRRLATQVPKGEDDYLA